MAPLAATIQPALRICSTWRHSSIDVTAAVGCAAVENVAPQRGSIPDPAAAASCGPDKLLGRRFCFSLKVREALGEVFAN